MSFWTTQYKHAEIARLQNKREERLLRLEIESKYGVRNVHRYNMQAVEHEQRLIERELERIRKGMTKKPLHPYAAGNIGNLALFASSHLSPRRESRHENVAVNAKNAEENLCPPGIDKNLFRGIVPSESDRPPPYAPTDTIQSYLAKSHDGTDRQSVENHPGLVLSQGRDLTGKQSRSHNIDSCGHTEAQVDTVLESVDELDSQDQSINEITTDRVDRSKQNAIPGSEGSRIKRRPVRTSLDIAQLASLDMKSVKSDVSRRLSLDHKDRGVKSNASEVKQDDHADTALGQEEPKPKEKTRRVSRSKIPAADSHKKVMDMDPEHYNPDGSLRKMHCMPVMDKTWEEAKKARYIRSKETAQREKELTVEEIFDSCNKTNKV